ncbi:hypothetical protein B0H14DRAFT_3859025 [Mycena olivaceomarginata]|nr:hypothetical protein B0H14DRAFT_3859025 [Mycena olivaceomarginata]
MPSNSRESSQRKKQHGYKQEGDNENAREQSVGQLSDEEELEGQEDEEQGQHEDEEEEEHSTVEEEFVSLGRHRKEPRNSEGGSDGEEPEQGQEDEEEEEEEHSAVEDEIGSHGRHRRDPRNSEGESDEEAPEQGQEDEEEEEHSAVEDEVGSRGRHRRPRNSEGESDGEKPEQGQEDEEEEEQSAVEDEVGSHGRHGRPRNSEGDSDEEETDQGQEDKEEEEEEHSTVKDEVESNWRHRRSSEGESDQDHETGETSIYDLRVTTVEIILNTMIHSIADILRLLSGLNEEARTKVKDVPCTIVQRGPLFKALKPHINKIAHLLADTNRTVMVCEEEDAVITSHTLDAVLKDAPRDEAEDPDNPDNAPPKKIAKTKKRDTGSPPGKTDVKIETDPLSVKRMKGKQLEEQLGLHRARGDSDLAKQSSFKLVRDKRAAVLEAIKRMERSNLGPKGKAEKKDTGSPPGKTDVKIENRPSLCQKDEREAAGRATGAPSGSGDSDLPEQSAVKLVRDKRAAVLEAIKRMERSNLGLKGKARPRSS